MPTDTYNWPGSDGDPLPSPWSVESNNSTMDQTGDGHISLSTGGVDGGFCYAEESSLDVEDVHVLIPITRNISGGGRCDVGISLSTSGGRHAGELFTANTCYLAFIRWGSGDFRNISIYKLDAGSVSDQSAEFGPIANTDIVVEFERAAGQIDLTLWNAAMDTQLGSTSLDDSTSPLGSGGVSIGQRYETGAGESHVGTTEITYTGGNVTAAVPPATLGLTAPPFAAQATAHVTADVPPTALALDAPGFAAQATAHVTAAVPTAQLALLAPAFAAHVSADIDVPMPVASLALSSPALDALATDHVTINVPPALLTLTTDALAVAATGHVFADVPPAQLLLSPRAFNAIAGADIDADVPPAQLVLSPRTFEAVVLGQAVPVRAIALTGVRRNRAQLVHARRYGVQLTKVQ